MAAAAMTTWDDAADELARTLRVAIAELDEGDYPEGSPEWKLLRDLRAAVDEWDRSRP
jgi:hypothetical protein